MYHFVQRVHGFAPPMLDHMFARHDDLRRHVFSARIEVRESRGHATGQANGECGQCCAKMQCVELSMRFGKLRHEGESAAARRFRSAWCWRPVDLELQAQAWRADRRTQRFVVLDPRMVVCLDEGDPGDLSERPNAQ